MLPDSAEQSAMTERINFVLGTIMMSIGSAMAILIFADRSGAELSWLPAVWFDARDFHILICVMIFALAALVLKGNSGESAPVNRDTPFQSVRLYTRDQCELCVRAHETLLANASIVGPFEIVDIDQSPELKSRFDNCVPVLEVDGKVRFRGNIRPELLARLADGARRQRELKHSTEATTATPAVDDNVTGASSR